MNEPIIDPRITKFERDYKPAPIGHGCHVSLLRKGSFWVTGKATDKHQSMRVDGEYSGRVPFKVTRANAPGKSDVVRLEKAKAEEPAASDPWANANLFLCVWWQEHLVNDSGNPDVDRDSTGHHTYVAHQYTGERAVQDTTNTGTGYEGGTTLTFPYAWIAGYEWYTDELGVDHFRMATGDFHIQFEVWEATKTDSSYYSRPAPGDFTYYGEFGWDFSISQAEADATYWPGMPGPGELDPVDYSISWITDSTDLVTWPSISPGDVMTGSFTWNPGIPEGTVYERQIQYETMTRV